MEGIHLQSRTLVQFLRKLDEDGKRVRKDNTKALNGEAILHVYEKGWINEWEYNFSVSTIRKRKLTAKKALTRAKVNEKMLFNMKRTRAC
jgi:hypothetical protein